MPKTPDLPVGWHWPPPQSALSWRGWLGDRLLDDPAQPVHGWRSVLSAQSDLDLIFRTCEARVRDLASACPERRDLVHGDLIHQEPSVTGDADALVYAPLRHHCYELSIGLEALAWNSWIGNAPALQQTAGRLAEILERGPLPAST